MEKSHKNGKMTLDKLARIMANSFGEVKQELGNFKVEVNERFNRVEDKLDDMDRQFYELHNNDEIFSKEVGKLNKRVSILEHKVFPRK